MKKYIIVFISLLTIFSCTEEISPSDEFEPKIFIFGEITTDQDYVSLKVGKTLPLNNSSGIEPLSSTVENAEIALFTRDTNDNTSLVTDDFSESLLDPGEYISSQVVTPIIGNYYWIEVTIDGTKYKSSPELLKPPITVTEIEVVGNQVRAIFNDPQNEVNHYYAIFNFYDANDFFLFDESELSNDILFNGNENAFIETEDTAYFSGEKKYGVTLAHLNFDTYQFYQNITIQNQSNEGFDDDDEGGDPGRLFDSPPTSLTGNIVNTATNRLVLGNFGVISISDEFIK